MTDGKPGDIPQFIRRLMPAADESQLQEAADTFKQYLAVVIRIHDRLAQEGGGADSL